MKTMAFGCGTTTTKKESLINLDGTAIQNLTEFKYLGYKLSNEENPWTLNLKWQ